MLASFNVLSFISGYKSPNPDLKGNWPKNCIIYYIIYYKNNLMEGLNGNSL